MEDTNRFVLKIIAPDRVIYEDEVDMVEFNTTEGEVGIYRNHIPMTMIISPGILTITKGNETKSAALHAGFTEILQDSVTILAEVIEWPEEIDLMRAQAAQERAQERIHKNGSDIDLTRAEAALKRALTRISMVK